jgi:hypothetical protein
MYRELDREGRSFSRSIAVGMDSATVQFHEVPRDRQAEAETTGGPRRECVRLSEPIEDERQKLRRNSFACIRN